jgi:hypothetical protein
MERGPSLSRTRMYVRARVHAARAVQTKSGETRFGRVARGQPFFAAKV